MQYSPIRIEYINPFVTSTSEVFHTMLNLDVRRGALYWKDSFQTSAEVTAVIGLTGIAKGSVLLGLTRPAAIEVTSILMNERCDQIDHNVIDAIGELANMIVGSAKAQMEELKMSIGLPTVVVGSNHSVVFPTGVQPIGIPFDSDIGAICLEVSLVDSN